MLRTAPTMGTRVCHGDMGSGSCHTCVQGLQGLTRVFKALVFHTHRTRVSRGVLGRGSGSARVSTRVMHMPPAHACAHACSAAVHRHVCTPPPHAPSTCPLRVPSACVCPRVPCPVHMCTHVTRVWPWLSGQHTRVRGVPWATHSCLPGQAAHTLRDVTGLCTTVRGHLVPRCHSVSCGVTQSRGVTQCHLLSPSAMMSPGVTCHPVPRCRGVAQCHSVAHRRGVPRCPPSRWPGPAPRCPQCPLGVPGVPARPR